MRVHHKRRARSRCSDGSLSIFIRLIRVSSGSEGKRMSDGSTMHRRYGRYEAYENLMANFDDEDAPPQIITNHQSPFDLNGSLRLTDSRPTKNFFAICL